MNALFSLVASILAAFYAAIPNYAVAIILLTVLVMAITTPLTLKSTRSMMMMQQLQPEMKRIQARFKDDRQRANEEMLKFYKENNINPLGGCIPLLVQMPVFFFLYAVLRGLTRRVSDVGFSPGYVAGQSAVGTSLSTPPVDLLPFDPAYLDHSSAMYQSLSQHTTMSAPPLNIDLSESMTQAWSRGALAALPYILLIGIVGFTSFYQQRQIQGRNPNQQVNPQTQTMMKIMPIILPVISLSLPAGLVLYFAVSNLWRVGLQGFISRSIYGIKRGDSPVKAGAAGKGDAAPSGGGGAFAGLLNRVRDTTATDDTETKAAASNGGRSNGAGANGKKPVGANGSGGRGGSAKNGTNRSTSKGGNAKGGAAKNSNRAAADKSATDASTESTDAPTKSTARSTKPAAQKATNQKANGRNGAKATDNGGGGRNGGSGATGGKSGGSRSGGSGRGTGGRTTESPTKSQATNGRSAPKKDSGTSQPAAPANPALQPRARRPKKG